MFVKKYFKSKIALTCTKCLQLIRIENSATETNRINSNGAALAVYGQQQLQDDMRLSLIAKSGYGRSRSSRTETSELPVSAKGRQDNWTFNLAAELVKDFTVNPQLIVSPLLSMEYGSAWISGYQEKGAGYYNLDVERQQAQSLISSVGSRLRYQFNANSSLLGTASLGYDSLARASHLNASTVDTSFKVTSADVGHVVGRVGMAYEYLTPGSNMFRVAYDYLGRDKGYNDNMLRLEWVWQQ